MRESHDTKVATAIVLRLRLWTGARATIGKLCETSADASVLMTCTQTVIEMVRHCNDSCVSEGAARALRALAQNVSMHADSRQALVQSGASDELATIACELDAAGQAELVATVRIVRHVIEGAGAKAIESAEFRNAATAMKVPHPLLRAY